MLQLVSAKDCWDFIHAKIFTYTVTVHFNLKSFNTCTLNLIAGFKMKRTDPYSSNQNTCKTNASKSGYDSKVIIYLHIKL